MTDDSYVLNVNMTSVISTAMHNVGARIIVGSVYVGWYTVTTGAVIVE